MNEDTFVGNEQAPEVMQDQATGNNTEQNVNAGAIRKSTTNSIPFRNNRHNRPNSFTKTNTLFQST